MKKRILTVFTALLFLFVSLAGYAAAEEEPAWEITRSAGITDGVPAAARAQGERDGTQEDALSGTGLTGKDVESFLEIDLRLIDQGKILYMNF